MAYTITRRDADYIASVEVGFYSEQASCDCISIDYLDFGKEAYEKYMATDRSNIMPYTMKVVP